MILHKDAFYNSKRWVSVRKSVTRRDNFICQYCGGFIQGKYIVHHKHILLWDNVTRTLDTDTVTEDDLYNPDNMIMVHIECHNIIHGYTDPAQEHKDALAEQKSLLELMERL